MGEIAFVRISYQLVTPAIRRKDRLVIGWLGMKNKRSLQPREPPEYKHGLHLQIKIYLIYGVYQELKPMIPDLTQEQKFMLHRIAIESRDMSRDRLIDELLGCWEDKFRQKQIFLASSKEAGYVFKFNEGGAYIPLEEDSDSYVLDEDDEQIQDIFESNSFEELDMESIVLDKED